jgi:hypothetical protein
MAGPAENGHRKSLSERSNVQQAAVRLLASGKPRQTVVKLLAKHVYPVDWDRDPKMATRLMSRRLRQWEDREWFRDAVYHTTMIHLDADLPTIMRGMSRRAKRRVDAARLVLEVTGRHNPRGEAAPPAVVQINFGGALPRPASRPQIEEAIEDAEVVEEDE